LSSDRDEALLASPEKGNLVNRLLVSLRAAPRRARTTIAVSLLVLLPALASASTVAPQDGRQMVAQAVAIVHATAVSSTSRWNSDHSLIVTETRFQVHETFKGERAATTTVMVPGGSVGKLLVEVPGAVPFAAGDEAVLFLVRDARGQLWVAGRGRLDVLTDAATGKSAVRGLAPELLQAFTTTTAAGPGSGSTTAAKTASGASAMPLASFESALRDLVRDVAAKGGR
jgi:hypothetical protein